MNKYYKDYAEYLSEIFPDVKVQKISINAGFSCPNRDGTIGRGGCIYCDNTTFTPSYCFGNADIEAQIEAGKKFFSRKYPSMKYLAYFQSFTNTFASSNHDKENLRSLYERALACEDVVGLIVGTRPDCLPDDVVRMLGEINRKRPVFVEIGAETSFDRTLELINRGHMWQQTKDAVERLAAEGIHVGLHLICGLPGEDEEMILESVRSCCELPVDSLKFHQLQVIKDTPLHRMVADGTVSAKPFDLDEYINLCCKIVNIVRRRMSIERFLASSPPEKVVAPKWGIKNYEFTNILINRLKKNEERNNSKHGDGSRRVCRIG